MKLMKRRVLGYFLVIAGIGIIVLVTVDLYRVFTGQKEPISAFSKGTVILNLEMPQQTNRSLSEESFPEDSTAPEMTPPDINPFSGLNENIVKAVNLIAHFLLATFITNAATKFARIGIPMIRPIKVSLDTISKEK